MICKTCGRDLPTEAFQTYKGASGMIPRRSCRECRASVTSAANRAWYEAHKDDHKSNCTARRRSKQAPREPNPNTERYLLLCSPELKAKLLAIGQDRVREALTDLPPKA